MNDEALQQQNTSHDGVVKKAEPPLRRYKFMTSILVRPRDKEIYVKFLEKVTKDAMVPTNRLLLAGVCLLFVAIFAIWLMLIDLDRLPYVFLPTILLMICSSQLAYYLIISTRKKSMLASIFTLLMMKVNEFLRVRSAKYGELTTIGIKSFKKGFLLFEDGDFGVCYAYAGQLGKSTLPAVANELHQMRFDYFIARSETSQEMTITSIKQLDVSNQVKYYKTLFNEHDGTDLQSAWVRYMASMMNDDVENKIAKNEVSIYQYLILREPNAKDLIKSIRRLESAAKSGMYSAMRQVVSVDELIESIGALSMISKKGADEHVKKEFIEEEKFKRN